MKRTRAVAALAATLMTAAGLTGCSSGGGGNDGSNGPVTISIVEIKKTAITAMQKAIPGFEAAMKKQGKNIKVKLIADELNDEQFQTKMTQQLIGGQAPDVLDIGENAAIAWSSAGYLAPLDDYLAKWDGYRHYYPSIKKAMVRQDGHVYNLIAGAAVQNFFYRKDVLTKLGVDTSQPKTWDELISRLEVVKQKTGDTPIVVPAGTAWGGGTWGEGFLPLLAGADQTFYDGKSGKWNLASPGWQPTFDLYAKLVDKGLLPIADLQNPNPWEPTKYTKFPEGKIQVAAQGTWGWRFDWGPEGASPISGLDQKVATWQYPALAAGGKTYGWSAAGGGYAITEKSTKKDAAMQFIEYLTTGKVLATQLISGGAASPRDDLDGVAPYSGQPHLLQAGKDLETSVYVATGDGADKVGQAVATATEQILSKKADGPQAYQAFVKNATDLLGPSLVKE